MLREAGTNTTKFEFLSAVKCIQRCKRLCFAIGCMLSGRCVNLFTENTVCFAFYLTYDEHHYDVHRKFKICPVPSNGHQLFIVYHKSITVAA